MVQQELDEHLYRLAVDTKRDLQAERCTIYQLEREKGEVWSRVALGLEGAEAIRLPISRGVVGAVARSGQTLNLKDAYNDPRFDRRTDQRTGYRTKSLITMPIRDAQGHIIGVFQALNSEAGFFSDEDEATLRAYCLRAAQLLGSA